MVERSYPIGNEEFWRLEALPDFVNGAPGGSILDGLEGRDSNGALPKRTLGDLRVGIPAPLRRGSSRSDEDRTWAALSEFGPVQLNVNRATRTCETTLAASVQ